MPPIEEELGLILSNVMTGFAKSFALLIDELNRSESIDSNRLADSFKATINRIDSEYPDNLIKTVLISAYTAMSGDRSFLGTDEQGDH